MYGLWLHGLYWLQGPWCQLSPNRLLNLSLSHSLDPWIKGLLGKALLSTVLLLWTSVTCGRQTQFCRSKIIDRIVVFSWYLIRGKWVLDFQSVFIIPQLQQSRDQESTEKTKVITERDSLQKEKETAQAAVQEHEVKVQELTKQVGSYWKGSFQKWFSHITLTWWKYLTYSFLIW